MSTKVYRAGIHIPVGIFNVFCFYMDTVLAILFFIGFFTYELQEDYRLKDGAYLDIYGWLVGFASGVIIAFILNNYGIIKM